MSAKSETPRTDAFNNAPADPFISPYVGMRELARQLERELTQARADNAALREDAERYRFLRSSNTDVSVLAELIRNARSENRFDAAIDQARQK